MVYGDDTVWPFENVVGDLDVVLDTVGGDTTERSWRVLRRGGVLVSVTASVPRDHDGVRGVLFVVAPNRARLLEPARLIDTGVVRSVVGDIVPLPDARQAYERGLRDHPRGKRVLRVADPES
jgi:NADPH:quinone reductase-like Zn-dependent oxidoreductase